MAVKLATGYIDLTVKSKGAMDKIARDIAGVGASGKSAGLAAGEGITAGITGKIQAGMPGVGRFLIGQFAKFAAPAAAAFGVGKIVGEGLKRAMAVDEARASLRGLGHDAETVASVMDSALKSVKGTAFSMGEAAGLAGVIVASGVKPGQELDRVLKNIADSSAVAQVDLAQMGDVWAKAAAKGKLDAQIVNSLLAMRVPIFEDLAAVTGKTAAEVANMVTAGQAGEFTFEDLQRAMEKYGGAALKTGETVSGSLKNMNAALGRLGEALIAPVFNRAAAFFQKLIVIIDNLTLGVKPAMERIEALVGNFFKGGFPSLALPGVDTSKFTEAFDKIKPLVADIGRVLGEAFTEVGPKLVSLGATLATHLVPVVQTVAGQVMQGVHLIMQVFKELAPVVIAIVGKVAEGFEKLAPKLVGVFHAAMPIIERFRGIIAAVMPVILGIIRRVMAVAGEMVPHIANAAGLVIDAIKGIIDAIVAVVDWIERWKEPIAIVAGVIGAMLVPALVKWAAQQVINLAMSAKTAIASGIETAAIYGMIVAEKARAIAMAISTGAAKALSVAMAAAGGPIGLIIIGITALIAGLVLFFTKTEVGRKIWTATWNWIKKAAANTWNFLKGIFSKIGSMLKPVIDWFKKWWQILVFGMGPVGIVIGIVTQLIKHWDKVKVVLAAGWNVIKTVFSTGWQIIKTTLEVVGNVIMWLWQKVCVPAFQGIKFAVQVGLFPIKVAVAAAKIYFQALGQVALWLWRNAIQPAFNAIKTVVAAVVGFLVGRFNNLVNNIKIVGGWFTNLWRSYVVPAWEGIKSAFSTAWQFVLGIFNFWKDAFTKYIGEPLMRVWNEYVVPAWEGIKGAFQAAWDWIQGILDKIKSGFGSFADTVKSIAEGIASGVKSAFSGMVDAMKIPLRKFGDFLASAPQSALGVPIPGMGKIKEWGEKLQSLQGGGVAQRTPKGLLRGPGGPRSDSILGVGPTGMPLVRVSPGEGVVAARAMLKGGNKIVAALNAGWVPSADFLHALVPGLQRGGQVSLASLKKGVAAEENLQPYTVLMARAVSKAFPQIKSIGGYRADAYEWHPTGRAIDVMIPNYNTPKGKALGDSIASFIVANRRALGLRDFIWRQKFYTAEGKGNQMEDRGSPTQNHMDHLHIVCNYGQPKGGSINIGRGGGGGRAPAGGGRGGAGGRAAGGGGRGGARGPGARQTGPTEAQQRQMRGQEQRIGNLQQQIDFQERELAAMEAKEGKGKPTDIQLEKKRAQIDKSRQQLENVESDFAALQAKTGVARGGAAATGAFQALPEAVPLVQNPDGTWTSPDPAWAALIKRESGGRADIIQQIVDANTGGNEAEGLFQIAKGTWAGAGGREFAPTAGAATPQQQAVVAARIFRTSGGKPWGAGLAGRENEAELAAGLDDLTGSLEDASDALGDFGDELDDLDYGGGGGGGGGDGGGKRPWQHEALDELLGKAGEVADIAAGGLVENLPPGFGNPMDWPVMKSISGLFGFFSGLTDDPVAKGLLGMGAAGFAGSPSGMISSIKGMMPKPFGETGGAGTELSPDDFIALGEPIGGSMADAFTGMASDMLPEMGGQQSIDNSIHIGENGTVGQDPAAVDDVARRRGQAQSRAALGGSIGRAYQ